jgi:hypothetical protein
LLSCHMPPRSWGLSIQSVKYQSELQRIVRACQ